ncbi:MAG: hypothetical protein ACLS5A_06890 [Pseudoruminococcus massiliensis]|uniref:hypothetical protein n=1 Tax=Pseudoruminococcus massiliensis TaxID=2086583 RepID=UPI0039961910
MKYLAMNYRNGRIQFAPTITSIKTIKSFAQAFSKACRSRATPLSLSAESEILLGEAQHLFFLKIGGFYPPINFLLLATLVTKGGQSPPLECKKG